MTESFPAAVADAVTTLLLTTVSYNFNSAKVSI